MPEIVFAELEQELARTEPDPEIHQLIHDSAGLNLALDYLPGSVAFDPLVHTLDAAFMARIVWFDALVTNVDRTARNTNMLMWHRRPWLIDHGATLFFHHAHGWQEEGARARDPFARIGTHVLRHRTHHVPAEDAALAAALAGAVVDDDPRLGARRLARRRSGHHARGLRARYFRDRLAVPRAFVEEAARAR